jgi:ankyrin repeat protein
MGKAAGVGPSLFTLFCAGFLWYFFTSAGRQPPAAVKPEEKPEEILGAARKGDLPKLRDLISRAPDAVRKQWRDEDSWEARKFFMVHYNDGQTNDEDGYTTTLMHEAVRGGHRETMEFLLAQKADINAKNKVGVTPLDLAMRWCNTDILEWLLEHGAAVNARSDSGETPLHEAALQNRLDAVQTLLAHRADVNARDHIGSTPLMSSAEGLRKQYRGFSGLSATSFPTDPPEWPKEPIKVMTLLIANHADVGAKTTGGATVLHIAARNGPRPEKVTKEEMDLLLKYHPDVNARDGSGRTALHYAAEMGTLVAAKALLAHHADPTIRNSENFETPVQAAYHGSNGPEGEPCYAVFRLLEGYDRRSAPQ